MEKKVLIQNPSLAKTPLYPEISIYTLNVADLDLSFFPRPGANQVYIWKIGISLFNERIQFLRTFLSHDEIDKADRYRFMEDTSRFVVSRAILRLVCGSCLSMNPEEIRFEYGKNGKPGIAGLYENSPFFNLSHSGDIVLVAFSSYRNTGVDVELTRDIDDFESIAINCFHPAEANILTKEVLHKKKELFFRLWTAKEAFLKSRGTGLGRSLKSFSVSPLSDNFDFQGELECDEGKNKKSLVFSFVPEKGYSGALAVSD